MSIQKFCEFCRTELTFKPISLLKKRRFCNRTCRSSFFGAKTGAAMKEALRIKNANKLPWPEITCAQCGKNFKVTPARLNTAKFCSYRCGGLSNGGPEGGRRPATVRDGKSVKNHIAIAKQLLGLDSIAGKNVHHIDGNTRNNALANLIVLDHGQHTSIHMIQRHQGVHLSAEDIIAKFPNALWLSNFVPTIDSRGD